MPPTGTQPEISVVICSHNGARSLVTALDSLRRQSLAPDQYEVIVVDDGSRDQTAQIAEAEATRVVRLAPNRGLAAARNVGVSAARASIVAFTDDDCVADERWLAMLLAAFADPRVDGVGGRVVPDGPDCMTLRYLAFRNPLAPLGEELLRSDRPIYRFIRYLRTVAAGEPTLSAGEQLYSVVGANMAFRRARIYDWGGFDEAFRFGGEEEDLCRRAHRRPGEARLVYQPAATVLHRFEPSVRDAVRRSRAYGRGNARAAIKHADFRPILFPFPLLVVLAVVVGAWTRRPRVSLLGLLAPLLTYPRWTVELRRRTSVETLAYPYIQLAQESSTMLGEVDGYRAGYRAAPPTHLVADTPPRSSTHRVV